MTETTEVSDERQAALSPAVERFILHWGDMGAQWGVNRSVAQLHALLYLSDRPLAAEEIAERLSLARSNVSNSLRELATWKLVRRVPVLGDRRDFFEAETDLWRMLTRIAAGRKEREIDPAIDAIALCLAEADGDRAIDRVAHARMKDMSAFLGTLDRWYAQMLAVPPAKLMALIGMGSKIVGLLGLARKPRPD